MKYRRYIIYDKDTGKIKRTLQSTNTDIEDNLFSDSEAYIEGVAHVLNDYVKGGRVTRRPQQPTVLDGLTLNRVPFPCVLKVNCTEYPCEDSTAELDFDQPGRYRIKISAWPYFDKEFTVDYTPS